MGVIQANQDKVKSGRRRPSKMKEKLVSSKACLAIAKMPGKQVTSNMVMTCQSQKRKRATLDCLYDSNEDKSAIIMRAREVQANLAPEFPSIIKYMLPSHVTGGFWLGLPKKFCHDHLPKQDVIIVLEDESRESYITKYLAKKVGLSGGWRGFSIAHKLEEGDVCVFHLVRPDKFKVYIIKINGSDEVCGALGLLNLDACKKQMDPVHREMNLSITTAKEMGDQDMGPSLLEQTKEIQKKNSFASDTNIEHVSVQSGNESEDFGFSISDGIRLAESVVDFKEVKSFEDFGILVNGLVINTELSKFLQTKYYELCRSQNSFLHDKLLEGLNLKLISGVIAETINIADAIRASKPSTSFYNFVTWEKTLKSFDTLGMNVGFLLGRLDRLMKLNIKSNRLKEARVERENVEGELRSLEAKTLIANETICRLEHEIQMLEADSEDSEFLFQEVAKAPW